VQICILFPSAVFKKSFSLYVGYISPINSLVAQFLPLPFGKMLFYFLAPNIWILIILSSYYRILLMNCKLAVLIFF
jgi:hypothetical protein